MKQPKKPTLAQKRFMTESGLDWKTWNVAEETDDAMVLISKKSGRRRIIKK